MINGAPGSGKSTVAHHLAGDRPLDLALDVDGIKHALGQWKSDALAAGYHARRLAIATADVQLRTGHNVYVGQFLAKPEFIVQLEAIARGSGATFVEVVLMVDQPTLTHRLARRAAAPERPEHPINSSLIGPDDVPELIQAIDAVILARPDAIAVDASGDLNDTIDRVRRAITGIV